MLLARTQTLLLEKYQFPYLHPADLKRCKVGSICHLCCMARGSHRIIICGGVFDSHLVILTNCDGAWRFSITTADELPDTQSGWHVVWSSRPHTIRSLHDPALLDFLQGAGSMRLLKFIYGTDFGREWLIMRGYKIKTPYG